MNNRMVLLGIGLMLLIGLVVSATNPVVGSILSEMFIQTPNGQAYQVLDGFDTTTYTNYECTQPAPVPTQVCNTVPAVTERRMKCDQISVLDSNEPIYETITVIDSNEPVLNDLDEITDYTVISHEEQIIVNYNPIYRLDNNCYENDFVVIPERQECKTELIAPAKVCGNITKTKTEPIYKTVYTVTKDLNGNLYLDINQGVNTNIVMANEIYTKSKVPESAVKYCVMIRDANIYNKATHYAYRNVNGKYVLDAEYRWVVIEGCLKIISNCEALFPGNPSKVIECKYA